jgi:hypothetical protein
MHLFSATLVAVVVASCAQAGWQCQNPIEVACGSGQCAVSEAFTPMSMAVGTDGSFDVCAYSYCASDPNPTTIIANGFLSVSSTNLQRETADGQTMGADTALISIDLATGRGTAIAHAYLLPILCHRSES